MRFVLLLGAFLLQAAGTDAITAEEMFAKAAMTGDLATIETLLSTGLNPDLPDRRGQTPLSLALSSNQTAVADLLLRWHADPNAPLKSGRDNGVFPVTPLQYAAQQGNLRMASRLIAAGAQVNAAGVAGRNALHFAGGRQLDMMQLLIEKGADVNARDAEGASPLDDAVWTGSLDAAAILLAHGARLNDVDTATGATPLNESAFQGHTALVQYLLQFRPDLDRADKRGYRPLDNAIRMGREDAALLLLEAEPKESRTPQFLGKALGAAIVKDESSLVDALLRNGAPVNVSLLSGATPLDEAAASGSIKAMGVLLEHKADPNVIGRNGTTPLEDSSLKGSDAIVSLLLDHGALINQLNAGSGTTALYAAASFGRSETVKLLLDRRADPGLCGANKKTPYQAALANGHSEVALRILNSGGGNCKP